MAGKKVVKRKGHFEEFDEKKAYGSVYWACKSSHLGAEKCELISQKVVDSLKQKTSDKKEVNSDEIFEFISKELEKHHKDAAYMYRTHRDIS